MWLIQYNMAAISNSTKIQFLNYMFCSLTMYIRLNIQCKIRFLLSKKIEHLDSVTAETLTHVLGKMIYPNNLIKRSIDNSPEMS